MMNPRESITLPETTAYLTEQIEWYEEIEGLIIAAIMYRGTLEAIDTAIDLKRKFLQSLNVGRVEEYLSHCRPQRLPTAVLYKMLDESYKLCSKE